MKRSRSATLSPQEPQELFKETTFVRLWRQRRLSIYRGLQRKAKLGSAQMI